MLSFWQTDKCKYEINNEKYLWKMAEMGVTFSFPDFSRKSPSTVFSKTDDNTAVLLVIDESTKYVAHSCPVSK